jgi:hypothetical protein
MPMQGMCEDEVVLVGAIIEVGIVDVGGELVTSRFVSSYGGDFYDLGIEEEEERKSGEVGMELEPALVDI